LFSREPRLRYSISYTTRPPRPGEVDGVSYTFVDADTFARLEEAGEFLEAAVVHGNRYGTSRRRVEEMLARGEHVLLKIDVQGAATVRDRLPDAFFIFLLPPSIEVLRQRLRDRGTDDADALARRDADALREMAEAERYDHLVVNDSVERAATQILDIVEASCGANAG
ncbi:MAG: guanylate kinase, partial [Candidatus Dormibacteria bacterium]